MFDASAAAGRGRVYAFVRLAHEYDDYDFSTDLDGKALRVLDKVFRTCCSRTLPMRVCKFIKFVVVDP